MTYAAYREPEGVDRWTKILYGWLVALTALVVIALGAEQMRQWPQERQGSVCSIGRCIPVRRRSFYFGLHLFCIGSVPIGIGGTHGHCEHCNPLCACNTHLCTHQMVFEYAEHALLGSMYKKKQLGTAPTIQGDNDLVEHALFFARC